VAAVTHGVRWCAAFLVLLLGTSPALGAGEGEAVSLTLREAVFLALERNLDLKIERFEPFIAHEEIRRAQGEFDPFVNLALSLRGQELPINSALEQQANQATITDDSLTPEGTVGGKFVTGTRYNLGLVAPGVQTDNPNRLFDEYYRPVLGIELVQPLLKGFGPDVNKIRIRQAEKGERIARHAVEAKMMVVIQDVETRYWTLHKAQQHARIVGSSVDVALDLVQRLRRLYAVGLTTALDVRQAEVTVESRRSDLALAQAELRNAQALLALATDPRSGLSLTARLQAVEAPKEEGIPVDLAGKLERAIAERPEIRRQVQIIEQLALQVKLDENNVLPNLDVVGSAGYTGLAGKGSGPRVTAPPASSQGSSYFDAFNNFFTPDGNLTWSVGLRLQIPLGNREALGRLEQSKLRREQEEMRLSLLKSQIGIEVETAFQEMTAAWGQILAASEGVRLAQEQLAAQERQLEAGLSTVRRVLEAQEVVSFAEDRRIEMVERYARARSRLAAAGAYNFDLYQLMVQP
jgi:outer membrane protein TolC